MMCHYFRCCDCGEHHYELSKEYIREYKQGRKIPAFSLWFRKYFISLTSSKLLSLDNKNKKKCFFVLYCPRLFVTLQP